MDDQNKNEEFLKQLNVIISAITELKGSISLDEDEKYRASYHKLEGLYFTKYSGDNLDQNIVIAMQALSSAIDNLLVVV